MRRSAVPLFVLTPALLVAMAGSFAQAPSGPSHAPGAPPRSPAPPRSEEFAPPIAPPPLPPPRGEAIAQLQQAESAQAELGHAQLAQAKLERARHAVELTRRGGDRAVLAAALLHLADVHATRGEFRDTLPALQEAAALAQGLGDARLQRDAAMRLSDGYRRLDDVVSARYWEQRANASAPGSAVPALPLASEPAPLVAAPSPSHEMPPSDGAAPGSSSTSWQWAIFPLCGLLLLAWWHTRRRAEQLAAEAAQLQRRQQRTQTINARLQAESEQLRQQAVQDTLTGALTRQAFAAGLKDLLQHASHYGRTVALLVLDLDHFKTINDQFGHLAGDNALKLLVGIARENLGSGDLLGRFGGDECLIATMDAATIDRDAPSAYALAESIRTAAAQRAGANASLSPLRVSIGVAHASPASGYDLEHLFRRADAALYAAKRAGRDRVALEGDRAHLPTEQPTLRHLSAAAAGEPIF